MAPEEATSNTDGGHVEEEIVTFEFPIREIVGASQMKNIHPSALASFHGISSEDPNAFLFEFNVLCMSYDFSSNGQKLNPFPTTLKDVALRWFMGLGSNSIATWDEMKKVFLKKYQDYCKTRDLREEIFGMIQNQRESLEDLVGIFKYNIQRSKMNQLRKETLRIILLRVIRLEYLEVLNLMRVGDVSKLSYDEVCELCRRYS